MPNTPESISYIKIGENEFPIDAVTLGGSNLPNESSYLPSVSSQDENKILMILQEQWTLTNPGNIYDIINGVPCGDTYDYALDYLTFKVLTPGTILWKENGENASKTIQYSINGGGWTSITSSDSAAITVAANDVVRFKGNNDLYGTGVASGVNYPNYTGFNGGTATYNAYGNIMSLIYGDNFAGQTTLPSNYTFAKLFEYSNVVSAEHLILPATTMTSNCYRAMFSHATLLEKAPELPSINLASNCYQYMFEDTAITKAPDLLATHLAGGCYDSMFKNCSNLNYVKCLAVSGILNSGNNSGAEQPTNNWMNGVSSHGTFVRNEYLAWRPCPNGWTIVENEYDVHINESDTPDHNYSQDYLTFTILNDGTIGWKNSGSNTNRSISYSINNGAWTSMSSYPVTYLTVSAGDKVRFKGTNTSYGVTDSNYSTFGTIGTSSFEVSGNIMSLLYGDNFVGQTTLSEPFIFRNLFDSTNVISAKNLILPATTLSTDCYRGFLCNCSSLVYAPELPATTLTDDCYMWMFGRDISLVKAPDLLASTLYTKSYEHMFEHCSSLNYIRCLATDNIVGNTVGWTMAIETLGTFVKDKNTSWSYNGTNTGDGVPQHWVIYDDDIDEGDSDSDSEYDPYDYSKQYLTMNVINGGNISWTAYGSNSEKTIQYSINGGEWTSITSSSSSVLIPVSRGDEVRFKGTNMGYATSNKIYSGFGGENGTASYSLSGNIMSLIYGDNFIGQKILPSTYTFCCMFDGSKAVYADNLILPAPSLTPHCYRALFANTPTLMTAPELPALNLGESCYRFMFQSTSITESPVLPATTLVKDCYYGLFDKCAALTYIKCLATSGLGTTGCTSWVRDVGPTGTFVKDPNANWSTGVSGIPTGWVPYDVGNEPEPEEEDYGSETPILLPFKYAGQEVGLPYSINAIDGHSSSYGKGNFQFSSSVILDEVQPTRLDFDHADQSADISVNGYILPTHWGGYSAFSVDITDYVMEGKNDLKVTLCNTTRSTLAPCSADFNFNATLGDVKLLSSPVLPDIEYGYDGFHITSTVTSSSATINVTTSVPATATLVLTIDDGTYYYTDTQTGTGDITFTTTIQNPHLWDGKNDPHLYDVTLEFYHNGILYHTFTRPYGFRYYSYVYNDTSVLQSGDPYTGFLLNGHPYLLRGVCMHQDIEGKANALSSEDIAHDFDIITELGANFIRTAHYPHPREFYDWCDRLGIVVQTEVPMVNVLKSTQPTDYYTHLEGQYVDMVTNHYNHPSIIFWGLGNEFNAQLDDKTFAKEKLEDFRDIIKSYDSERLVGYVLNQSGSNPRTACGSPDMDWYGCNIYVGWYSNSTSNDPTGQINQRLNNVPDRPIAYSEYGCGGNPNCHSDDHLTTTTCGSNKPRHDIEHQMWLHEGHIAAIKNFPQLIFTSMWVLFDFAVTSRQEGYTICLDGENTTTDDSYRFLNNKGLVERDHITKKDTFYLYKAWWNPTSKFVHICQKNYEKYTDRVVKCYTNDGTSLSLYVNNTFVETVTVTNNIAEFTAANYSTGDVIRVEGDNTNDTWTI